VNGASAAALAALLAFIVTPARADMVTREAEIVNLRLGQKVLVDDGSCPAGQIKLVSGVKLAVNGVLASRQCVDRKSARR
jgi:hypothetical protein